MPEQDNFYNGRRLSYDGALCTVRCKIDRIPGTKGDWLGVEWDDPSRGKHNGILNGVQYFQCRSTQPTVASFVRPARKCDAERTVLEAIKFKYAADATRPDIQDAVVISGKVAEEVGFDKIIKEQSMLANLKIIILDFMVVVGIAARMSSSDSIKEAQKELAATCPNVTELDLSCNPIETWAEVEEICAAFPNLRTLKLNVRLRSLEPSPNHSTQSCFRKVQELHLNECLLGSPDIAYLLQAHDGPRFPALRSLWLSQNEMFNFGGSSSPTVGKFETVQTLMLENNFFTSLDPVASIMTTFPGLTNISLQANKIHSFGFEIGQKGKQHPGLKNINLSQNNITSFEFVDRLPQVFSGLSALRISKNPVYDTSSSNTQSIKSSETSYYLTLARISTLRTLNYTDITAREREEGEIYYLSVAEKDIRTTLAKIDAGNTAARVRIAEDLTNQYPRYRPLCEKHDRENIITQLTSTNASTSDPSKTTGTPKEIVKSYPPGTLASRLVTATFYLSTNNQSLPSTSESTSTPQTFTRSLPNTIATSSIYALVTRALNLTPLTFKLIYESDELDPVGDDLTTRSQIYADRSKGARRWDDWGDWDADAAVERSLRAAAKGIADGEKQDEDEKKTEESWWNDDGVLVKAGRKWKRREVEMLFGMKSWGDWLESGVRTCKIRVEPVERKKV